MAELLEGFVKKEIEKQVQNSYTHLRYPASMYAEIKKAKNNTYTIKILDKNKNPDYAFPEIPFVKSDLIFEKGDIVVIILLYGECTPYIIGRA